MIYTNAYVEDGPASYPHVPRSGSWVTPSLCDQPRNPSAKPIGSLRAIQGLRRFTQLWIQPLDALVIDLQTRLTRLQVNQPESIVGCSTLFKCI